MAKIGRNEKCPCRSGRKFKHCCARLPRSRTVQPSPEEAMKITLMSGVREIQNDAVAKKALCRELGVFFFYSTTRGDAWLLEMTQCDCIQVARDGDLLDVPIDENPETIEINWSHTYQLNNKQLQVTAYSDKKTQLLEDAPGRELNGAMRRIRKKFSQEQLAKVHLESPQETETP